MAEVFSATFSPRIPALKLIGPPLGVVNASFAPRIPAIKLSQANLVLSPVTAEAGHTVAAPSLASTGITITPVAAEAGTVVGAYQIDAKPIGQWTVGTDFVAIGIDTTKAVALSQHVAAFGIANGTQGHTVAAPTANTNDTIGVANATTGNTGDPVALVQNHSLGLGLPEAGHTVVAPAFAGSVQALSVANAENIAVVGDGFPSFGVNLDQQHTHGVANAEHGSAADVVSIFSTIPNAETPTFRTFRVTSEERRFAA